MILLDAPWSSCIWLNHAVHINPVEEPSHQFVMQQSSILSPENLMTLKFLLVLCTLDYTIHEPITFYFEFQTLEYPPLPPLPSRQIH